MEHKPKCRNNIKILRINAMFYETKKKKIVALKKKTLVKVPKQPVWYLPLL